MTKRETKPHSAVDPYIKKAIDRFEEAVHEHAFLGTIPCDSEDALQMRECIEYEYGHSRKLLENLIGRRINK